MPTFNTAILLKRLQDAGVLAVGCNAEGRVWGMGGVDMTDDPAVQVVLAGHDEFADLKSVKCDAIDDRSKTDPTSSS